MKYQDAGVLDAGCYVTSIMEERYLVLVRYTKQYTRNFTYHILRSVIRQLYCCSYTENLVVRVVSNVIQVLVRISPCFLFLLKKELLFNL